MTQEEALTQAHVELDPSHEAAVTARADELFANQIPDLEATLATKRAEVDAMQAELDNLKAALPQSEVETPAEEAAETPEQEAVEVQG